MSEIILPRQYDDGSYYVSYSQVKSWNDVKSFNLSTKGRVEYMVGYFFGKRFPDAGWGEFGQDVEDYVCEKIGSEKFSKKERKLLDTVEPLGNFQIETKLELLPNVSLKGFIDDGTMDLTHIRDYKTGSANSVKQYYTEKYKQLDIYSGWVYQETGKLPDRAEVVMVERKGNCFGMQNRRDLLSVGDNVWYHDRELSMSRVDQVIGEIKVAVFEISEAYKMYLRMKKIV